MFNEKSNNFLNKIEKLKNWSKSISNAALKSDYFNSLPENYVGSTGLTKEDLFEKILKIAQCAENIYVHKIGEEKPVLYDANFCQQNSVCPVCASRVAHTRRKKLKAAILNASKVHPFAYLITLTIRNRQDRTWYSQTEAIKKYFRRFQRMGQLRYKKNYSIALKGVGFPNNEIGLNGDFYASDKLNTIWKKKNDTWIDAKQLYSNGETRKIKAGFYAIEMKRGEGSKAPHVHIHMIAFTDELLDTELYYKEEKQRLINEYGTWFEVPQEKKNAIAMFPLTINKGNKKENVNLTRFALQWYNSTEEEGYITDVHLMNRIPEFTKGNEWKRKLYAELSYSDSIYEQCKEVIKYTAKLNEHSGNDVVEILDETGGVRFFATFGEFYGMIKEDEYREEVNLNEGEISVYQFNSKTAGRYIEKGNVTELIKREHQFKFVKGRYLAIQAKMIGRYRNKRKAAYYAGIHQLTYNCAKLLNDMKRDFRQKVSLLWERYKSEIERITSPGNCKGNPFMLLRGVYTCCDSYELTF